MNWQDEINEDNAKRRLNILKGFKESDDALEKAKSGVYGDNPENRRLGRVGLKYGQKGENKAPRLDYGNEVTGGGIVGEKSNIVDLHKDYVQVNTFPGDHKVNVYHVPRHMISRKDGKLVVTGQVKIHEVKEAYPPRPKK